MRETTTTIGKLEYKVEKLRDKAEVVADNVADCKLGLIGAKFRDEAEARNYKDTHVDLSMEMWILHNKSREEEDDESSHPSAESLISLISVSNYTFYQVQYRVTMVVRDYIYF